MMNFHPAVPPFQTYEDGWHPGHIFGGCATYDLWLNGVKSPVSICGGPNLMPYVEDTGWIVCNQGTVQAKDHLTAGAIAEEIFHATNAILERHGLPKFGEKKAP